MAERKALVVLDGNVTEADLRDGGDPLVILDGRVSELPPGDTLLGGGGGPALSGDLDILWEDSIDLADAMAGTLGPIQTQDSVDLTDAFVAKDLFHYDSVDMSDEFTTISGLVYGDSFDIADQLAGTLGPIIAPDTLDIGDEFVADAVTLPDSIDTDDAITGTNLVPTADDSVDMSDEMNQAVALDRFLESMSAADAFRPMTLSASDSVGITDQFDTISGLAVSDSFATDDSINETTVSSSNRQDSVAFGDTFPTPVLVAEETAAFGDAVVPSVVTLTEYGQAVESSSDVTNPTNILGNNNNTYAYAESVGTTLAQPPTVNYSIDVSFSDLSVSDFFTAFSSGDISLVWQVELVGIPTFPSVSLVVEWSNNNGSSYTQEYSNTFTTTQSKQTLFLVPPATAMDTEAEWNGWRVKLSGTADGGTALLSAGIRIRFYRIWISATVNT